MNAVRPGVGPLGPSTRLAVIALAAMLSLPFLLPVGIEPIPSFEAEWLTFALGAVAIAGLGLGARWAIPSIALLPLAFVAVIVVQIAAGSVAQPQLSWLTCLYLIWASGLACAGAWIRSHSRREEVVALLAGCVLAGALLNAVIAGIQAVGIPGGASWAVLPVYGGRPGGNLGQPNHLASHLVLGLVSLAHLRASGRLGAFATVPMLVGLGVALSFTGSRTGWLLVLGLLAGTFLLRRAVGARTARSWRQVLGTLAAVFLLCDLSSGFLRPQGLADASLGRFASGASSLAERLRIWEGAARMFLDSPLTGIGHGRFASDFFERAPDLAPPVPGVMTANAHSLPLQIAAEFGLVGLGLAAVFGFLWWQGVARGRMVSDTPWALGVAGAILLHGLVEYPLWYAYFLGPFALALGLAEGPRLECACARAGRFAVAGAGALSVLVLLTTAIDYRLVRAFADGEIARAGSEDQRAGIDGLAGMFHHSFLAGYAGVGLHRGLELSRTSLPQKLALSTVVVRVFPLPDVAYRHAVLLAMDGDAVAARAWWERAAAVYPDEAERWRGLGRTLGLPGPWNDIAAFTQAGEDS
jgi:O-antigen ligase